MKRDNKRINSITGKLEREINPEGLPAIWVTALCPRCEKFKECLGFKTLTEEEWNNVESFVLNLNTASAAVKEFKGKMNLECKRAYFPIVSLLTATSAISQGLIS